MASPTLRPDQRRKLSLLIARDFERADYADVLARYPGNEEMATCYLENVTKDVQAYHCLELIEERENTWIFPFLSRVVEQKWKNEKFRIALITEVRTLVRPASPEAAYVGRITDALDSLTGALKASAAAPVPGTCPGGPAACWFVRDNRDPIKKFVRSLDCFDALKALHDCLHVLQVDGADWLDDEDVTFDVNELPPEPITTIVSKLQGVVAEVQPRLESATPDPQGQIEAALESCRQCGDAANQAKALLDKRQVEDTEFALARLRTLVTRDMGIVDDTMFAMSRDLPLKMLGYLLVAGGKVTGPIAAKMSDAGKAFRSLDTALRARILEHSLWQATDARIRAVAAILGNPTATFLRDMSADWTAILQNLRVLLDPPPVGSQPIENTVKAALAIYVHSVPASSGPVQPGAPPAVEPVSVVSAFDEFRLKARLHFLAVDRALKAEFASLLPLRDALRNLDTEVKEFCECLPPT